MSITEIEAKIYRKALENGKKDLRRELAELDEKLSKNRDRSRFRHKGYSQSCIRTIMGDVDFTRRRYYDTVDRKYVFLLDEELGMRDYGKLSPLMAVTSVKLAAESTFRDAARQIGDLTGMNISHQSVWKMTQAVGSGLIAADCGNGTCETEVLFEEADGIWLGLQGEDRKTYGKSREMKVAIAYDGIEVNGGRRTCHGKVACAGFYEASDFREKTEETIRGTYNTDKIKMRVLNGDGAPWIFNRDSDVVKQLDVFHRNKAVNENVSEPAMRKLIMERLYAKDVDGAIEAIETAYNSVEDDKEREKIQNLQTYFTNNRDRLVQYTRRGIDVPSVNGDLEPAKLGAMESNVFSLIGNRMKGRRKCWTIDGADNMAAILCLKHTGKLDDALKGISIPAMSAETQAAEEEPHVLQIPRDLKVGKGYNGYSRSSLQGYKWLREFIDSDFIEMNT